MTNVLSLQITPKIGKKEENLEIYKNLIEKHSDLKPDLIVIPEFCNVGITYRDPKDFEEVEETSPTLNFFKKLAKQYNTYICTGSIIEKDEDKVHNTSYLIDRNGKIVGKYRKIHLYNYFGGGEGLAIEKGEDNDLTIVDTDFGKVGMSVCFDIRYSQMYRKMAQKGAEIFLCPAAYPFLNEWTILNKSRALDNLAYFVSANEVGLGANGFISVGNSCITNPLGDVISNAGSVEGIAFAKIDLDIVRNLRKEFPLVQTD